MIDMYQLLQENTAISAFKVQSAQTQTYELFFVHEKLETVRVTDTESVSVTVYADHDGKRGHASFKLFASTTEAEARAKIADAAAKAALISNEYYDLPADETLQGTIPSDFDGEDIKTVAGKIARAVFSADMLGAGSVNALEIFINHHHIRVRNSCGVDKCETKYTAMVEAIPTWNEGESVELYEAERFSSPDVEKLRAQIEQKMREVRDRGRAAKPETALSCPVLIPAYEFSTLCADLARGLNYASVYSHANPYSEGDAIQKVPVGDKLGITGRGVLPGSVSSALFDEDGTTLVDTRVIEDGRVVSYYGGSRFAQYLGRTATGNLPCIEVDAGTLSGEELASKPYFECVSMSGLQVDIFNDYIGGEVRLAYYVDGDTRIPMTGISISGKLSEALNTMRLSEACTGTGRYYGPAYALFDSIQIV